MRNREWEKDYQAILEDSLTNGELVTQGAAEKRAFPRFNLKSGSIWVKVDQSFDVIDVSVSGISFFSTYPFKADQTLGITLGKAFLIEAKVVETHLVEKDAIFLETAYRVACRFTDDKTGVRFLVMLKEMDNLEIGISDGRP
ncbi:MAG: hypothetical protein V3S29_02280 [bacterium]